MRKEIGDKVRFEVFKRDSFTCQYCGRKSPDVVLQVDHIKPVANGGDNEMINLVTSCRDCNSGKGAFELDDNSAIERQRAQLEELNERRLQLEMMLEWREGLRTLCDDQVDAFCADFARICSGYQVNDLGRKDVRKWLRRFTLEQLLIALEGSAESYLRHLADGAIDPACITKVFNYIPRVAACQKRGGHSPEERQLYYIRGILRNRIHVNERTVMPLLTAAYTVGCDLDILTDFAKRVKNWTEFRMGIEEWLAMQRRTSEISQGESVDDEIDADEFNRYMDSLERQGQ